MPVGNHPPVRDNWNQGNPIVFSPCPIKVVLQHLQPEKTTKKNAESDENQHRGKAKPESETGKIAVRIMKFAHAQARLLKAIPFRSDDSDPAQPADTAAEAG